jgi:hypothetical protein
MGQLVGHAALFNFLDRNRLGVLSSISADGSPQSALVGIAVTPMLEIVFDTIQTSRKYANLITNPSCSLVVGWDGEQTAQLEGRASQPGGEELLRYQSIYFSRWPDGLSRRNWPQIAYFVVRPAWIRYSDYGLHPPIIDEFHLDSQ